MQRIINYLFPPKMPISEEKKQEIDNHIKNDHVFVASKTYCPYCHKAKAILAKYNTKANIIELDEVSEGSAIQDYLLDVTGQRTVPNIFINGEHIGGASDLETLDREGKLKDLLDGKK